MRADSFISFVGNLNRHEPSVNKLRKDTRQSNPTNGFIVVGRNIRG
jgi:hypothetical protein